MKPDIGLSAKNLDSITAILRSVLANAMVLYIKTRKFHWNVSGNSFMELHELFESHYNKLEKSIDEIAERINKLGAPTPGTMKEFLDTATLEESPGKYPSQSGMLKELLSDHESVIKELRKFVDESEEEHNDMGTSDFLVDLMKEHETLAWTLRRYLK
jgi:starvation-inducible DNA-binding protein